MRWRAALLRGLADLRYPAGQEAQTPPRALMRIAKRKQAVKLVVEHRDGIGWGVRNVGGIIKKDTPLFEMRGCRRVRQSKGRVSKRIFKFIEGK